MFGFVLSPFAHATVFFGWFSVVVSLLFSSHRLASHTCFGRFRLSVCILCDCDITLFISVVLLVCAT